MTDSEKSAAEEVLEREVASTIERLEEGKRRQGVCGEHAALVDGQILSIRMGEQTLKAVASLCATRNSNEWGSLSLGKFGKATGKSAVLLMVCALALGYMYFHSQNVAEKAEKVAVVAKETVEAQALRGARMERLLSLMESTLVKNHDNATGGQN